MEEKMLRITIEVVPYGDDLFSYPINKGFIVNDGKTSKDTEGKLGTYIASFSVGDMEKPTFMRGTVNRMSRKKGEAWDLLFCALYNSGFYDRNKRFLEKKEDEQV